MLNSVYLDGKENDLSAIWHDFSSLRNVEINVNNKVISVAIDETKFSERVFLKA